MNGIRELCQSYFKAPSDLWDWKRHTALETGLAVLKTISFATVIFPMVAGIILALTKDRISDPPENASDVAVTAQSVFNPSQNEEPVTELNTVRNLSEQITSVGAASPKETSKVFSKQDLDELERAIFESSVSDWQEKHKDIKAWDPPKDPVQELRFVSLLSQLDGTTKGQSPFDELSKKKLSPIAEKFSQDLYASYSFDSILEMKSPEQRAAALAFYIDKHKLAIGHIFPKYVKDKEIILSAIPHLRHVDLQYLITHFSVSNPGTEGFVSELLNACDHKNVRTLFIQDLPIKVLPELPACQAFNCSGCLELDALPNLPLCQTLDCNYCSKLRTLPDLPLCQTLDCNSCSRLRTLPELPACKKLDCRLCSELETLPDLPLCQKLDCSSCSRLGALPELPACKKLDCRDCPILTSLPSLPACQNLDCFGCTVLTTLPELPACQNLDCRDCPALTSLPSLPICRTLKCDSCPALTTLPGLPACQNLDCCGCTVLTTLPELPACQNLDCSLCPALTSLPELSTCQRLNCSFCPALTTLPSLPACQTLDCRGCPILTSLPELPACQRLNCRFCSELETLPGLPLCQNLDCTSCSRLRTLPALPACRNLACVNCPALTTLPELPACEVLNCSNCRALHTLPNELPVCHTLNCQRCPALRALPGLPINVTVFNNENVSHSRWEVHIEKLKSQPKEIMLELGKILQQNHDLPSIDLYENGKLSEAIDAGGVRRHVISSLIAQLNLNRENPEINPKNKGSDIAFYSALGRLMAFCYKNDHFVTGPAFSPQIYEWMHRVQNPEKPSEEWLIATYCENIKDTLQIDSSLILDLLDKTKEAPSLEKLSEDQLTRLAYLIDLENPPEMSDAYFKSKDNRVRARNNLLEEAGQNPTLQAVLVLAKSIKASLEDNSWKALCAKTADDLRKRIEGELTLDLVIDKLNLLHNPAVTESDKTQVKAFLTDWLTRKGKDEAILRRFVFAVTGNYSVGSDDIKILVLEGKTPDYLPSSHTCFFRLDIPAGYPNQKHFDEKMERFLSAADSFHFA